MGVEWQVEQLRFTWFFASRPSLLLEQRWKAVASVLPNIEIIQRFPNFVYRAEVQGPEPFASGWLTLHLEEARMDIFFGGRALVAQVPTTQAPVAGLLENQFAAMWDYLKQRDALFATPANRIAIGFIALSRVSSKAEGYRVLDELLDSVKLDPEGSSDFLYQINRPTEVEFTGRKVPVNRFTRWSVMYRPTPTVLLNEGGTSGDPVRQGGEEFWVRLEADINTAPGAFDDLPLDNQVEAFAALKRVADRLAKGEDRL